MFKKGLQVGLVLALVFVATLLVSPQAMAQGSPAVEELISSQGVSEVSQPALAIRLDDGTVIRLVPVKDANATSEALSKLNKQKLEMVFTELDNAAPKKHGEMGRPVD